MQLLNLKLLTFLFSIVKMKTVVVYVYHDENNEPDIPMQRLRCRGFAEQNNWTIVCELQEEGISGHKVRAEKRDKIQLIKGCALQEKLDIPYISYLINIGPFTVCRRIRTHPQYAKYTMPLFLHRHYFEFFLVGPP